MQVKCFNVETVSALEELVKKVLNDHKGKEYLEKAYRKLMIMLKTSQKSLRKKFKKGDLKKKTLMKKL